MTCQTSNHHDTIIEGDTFQLQHPTLHFFLTKGQCVQVHASQDSSKFDITGTTISSNKPIAVYGGHVASEIPSYFRTNAGNEGSLLEAIPPTTSWGKTFLCRLLAPRTSFIDTFDIPRDEVHELVRVLASSDGTIVKVNDTMVTTLQAGHFFDIDVRDPILIQTSNPALVAEYGHSMYRDGVDTIGGPFMAIIPPLEQRYNDLTFFNYLNAFDREWDVHYVVIAGDISIRNHINLDGKPLPDTGFVNLPFTVGGEQFCIGSYLVDSGAHHISTTNVPEKGMTLLVYGYGYVSGYGYGVGSLNKLPIKSDVKPTRSLSENCIRSFTSSPDPFRKETTLDFTLNRISYVTLAVYDELGRLVWGDGKGSSLEAGTHSIHLDGKSLPSGTLYARIATGFGEVKTVKLVHEK